MIGVGSYSCPAVEMPAPSSNTSRLWSALVFPGSGMGVMNRAVRREAMMRPVGCPSASSSR